MKPTSRIQLRRLQPPPQLQQLPYLQLRFWISRNGRLSVVERMEICMCGVLRIAFGLRFSLRKEAFMGQTTLFQTSIGMAIRCGILL